MRTEWKIQSGVFHGRRGHSILFSRFFSSNLFKTRATTNETITTNICDQLNSIPLFAAGGRRHPFSRPNGQFTRHAHISVSSSSFFFLQKTDMTCNFRETNFPIFHHPPPPLLLESAGNGGIRFVSQFVDFETKFVFFQLSSEVECRLHSIPDSPGSCR